MKQHLFVGVVLALLGFALPHAAQAQAYPAKPVRIVVPAAAGGGLDVIARIVAVKLTEAWGQQVFVENRAGANFILGTDLVSKAAPDGYTLIYVSSGALTINPVAYANLPYDPERDLVPITLVTSNPFILLVNKELPIKSVQDLIAYANANPQKLYHASNSASTMLTSELFKSLAKIEYTDVNYKGGILAVTSTEAGETQLCFVDTGSAAAAMQNGRIRALAVTTVKRFKTLPDVPTIAESGVPGYASGAWGVLLAPAKTPSDILSKINTDLDKILSNPEIQARFLAVGNEAVGGSAANAVQELRADREKWARLAKDRNIKIP